MLAHSGWRTQSSRGIEPLMVGTFCPEVGLYETHPLSGRRLNEWRESAAAGAVGA